MRKVIVLPYDRYINLVNKEKESTADKKLSENLPLPSISTGDKRGEGQSLPETQLSSKSESDKSSKSSSSLNSQSFVPFLENRPPPPGYPVHPHLEKLHRKDQFSSQKGKYHHKKKPFSSQNKKLTNNKTHKSGKKNFHSSRWITMWKNG